MHCYLPAGSPTGAFLTPCSEMFCCPPAISVDLLVHEYSSYINATWLFCMTYWSMGLTSTDLHGITCSKASGVWAMKLL